MDWLSYKTLEKNKNKTIESKFIDRSFYDGSGVIQGYCQKKNCN